MNLNKLSDPFPARDIEWRVQRSGIDKNGKAWAMVLPYVTNRAIMERLDSVCGRENWSNSLREYQGEACLCGIGIRVPRDDGTAEWVWKYDGAENTDIEAIKGGISGSMKRCAVQWDIGRYLYKLEYQFVREDQSGKHKDRVKVKGGEDIWLKWKDPELPESALPKGADFYKVLQEVQGLKGQVDESEYYNLMWNIAEAERSNKLKQNELNQFHLLLEKAVDRNERFVSAMKKNSKALGKVLYHKILNDLGAKAEPEYIKDKALQLKIHAEMEKAKKEKKEKKEKKK